MFEDFELEAEKIILPVYAKQIAMTGKGEIPQVYFAHVIQASCGDIISIGLPKAWVNYLVKKINLKAEGKVASDGKLLARIVIPDEPPTYYHSKVLVEESDGALRIKKSKELTDYIRKFDRNFSKYVKTKHNFPIIEKCNIKAEFHIPMHSKASLSDMMYPLETALFEVGIFENQYYNILKSWDGSRIVYEKDDVAPYTDVTIRRSNG